MKSLSTHNITGRGLVKVVDSIYLPNLKVDQVITIDEEEYLIRGIETTLPTSRTIGLVVKKL